MNDNYLPGFVPAADVAPFTYREPHQLVRRDDPITSHLAAEEIVAELRKIQRRVLDVLANGPMTDDALIARYRLAYGPTKESTIRTRRAELVEAGLVHGVGTVPGASRRLMTLWDVVRCAFGAPWPCGPCEHCRAETARQP